MISFSGVGNGIGRKSFSLLLNRQLCFLDNLTLSRSTRCFTSIFKPQTQSGHSFNYGQLTVLGTNCLSQPIREFSSSRAVFSNKDSNTKKLDRQANLLGIVLIILVLSSILTMSMMESHQDYVIIKPDNKK